MLSRATQRKNVNVWFEGGCLKKAMCSSLGYIRKITVHSMLEEVKIVMTEKATYQASDLQSLETY